VLARLGLIHASWTRRGFDAVSASAGTVHARLARRLAARDILLLHDGHPGPGKPGRALCLEVLPRLLEDLGARGLRSVPLTAGLAGR
jgi:peptidoglycan-N-acetylglucosamine deacetylase